MNNSEKIYLCFITTDAEKDAIEIYKDRIKADLWPIYSKTNQFRKVYTDVEVIFYIAGNGESSQNFVGSATINEVTDKFEKLDINSSNVKFYTKFKKFKQFKNSVYIKDILNKLDFIKIKDKYGLTFQGGVTEVDEKSYNLIMNNGNN